MNIDEDLSHFVESVAGGSSEEHLPKGGRIVPLCKHYDVNYRLSKF